MLRQMPALDHVFHALADRARPSLLERPLPMSLSAVGQHLAVRVASGQVKAEKVGRVRTCMLDA